MLDVGVKLIKIESLMLSMGKEPKSEKFVLSNSVRSSAKYVLFGVPYEGGSKKFAHYHGSAKGPHAIRKASQTLAAFHRKHKGKLKTFITNSFRPIDENKISLTDIGNIDQKNVFKTVNRILHNKQFPIMLGGDHSIMYDALRSVDKQFTKVAIVYFDAHPDFRSSKEKGNYATVMNDVIHLKNVVNKTCIEVGVRDIEPEEFSNMKKAGIQVITALETEESNIKDVLKKIKKAIGKVPTYISIDMDVLDPAFAPEVSTPSPGGLATNTLFYLLTELAKENIIGMDIVELSPQKGKKHMTAHVAARLLIEFLSRHSVRT
jgi:agmatinase